MLYPKLQSQNKALPRYRSDHICVHFRGKDLAIDHAGMNELLCVGLAAHMAVIAGVRPGNLRWLDEARDFVWRDRNGTTMHLDAYGMAALHRTTAREIARQHSHPAAYI